MPNKLFLKTNELYEAPNKRLQDDVEITGATITHTNGRISAITFGGGGAGGPLTLTSPDGSIWTITIDNDGVIHQSKP